MALTDRQQNEITYYHHRISLNKAKIVDLEANAKALLPKVNDLSIAREYLIHGENISKLKEENKDFERRIADLENSNR
ncbi:hypothetical protein ACS5NO_32165 [Larkinella sp. GY13]|uniref:hypothetical protein n=1 Tax=Larkinella sp. GY13 TaxID=3453720 RepID=UPI003EEEF339